MGEITLALLQLARPAGLEEALTRGLAGCREAAERGADIALLPEMWSNGYHVHDLDDAARKQAWIESAIEPDSEYLAEFRSTARELEIAIAATYLEANGDAPRNTVSVIDATGNIVLTYAKVHTCLHTEERHCGAGERFQVVDFAVRDMVVQLGAMICYDREFPESGRLLSVMGAELILVPNACILDRHRVDQFKTRAFENQTALAMTNYPAPYLNGRSMVVSPIAYAAGAEGEALETVVCQAGGDPEMALATLDVDAIRAYRKNAVWGPHFRRPELYADLTDPGAVPTFEPDAMVH